MTWQAENRAYLQAHIDRLATLLTGGEPGSLPVYSEPVPSLVALERIFGLTSFERDVVVMCIGAGLDARIGAHVNDAPTFGHAFAVLPDSHMDACSPSGSLRAHGLIRLEGSEHPMRACLALDERIFHFAVGNPALSPELVGLQVRLPSAVSLDGVRQEHALHLASLLRTAGTGTILQIIGAEQSALEVITAATRSLGASVLALCASGLPSESTALERLVRTCERELLLSGSIATIVVDSFDPPHIERVVQAFARITKAPLVVIGRAPLERIQETTRFEIPAASLADRTRAWTTALDARAEASAVQRLAHQFHLETNEIAAIAKAVPASDSDPEAALWAACRRVARPSIDDLARRIDPVATWDDLVLPPSLSELLRDMSKHLRFRHRVHDAWGFGRGESRGRAITALFHGPSGTGKTLAAEVIARDAGLDLYQVDLSQIVDEYVGETEKRLRRVFDAAERGGVVLLFDEADSLFGKRGTVERGTDRWANLEVSYLLQRMESYRGLAILTTNSRDAIDVAFLRRLRFVAQFPFPDVALRRSLWLRAFPKDAPTETLDTIKLAELQLTGASIKSIALAGAFHAAADTGSITMRHLLRAARTEFTKLEKPFPEAQVAAWSATS